MREYVKDGTVNEFALWNPADLGYLAAYAGAALASGQITGAEGDTFTAGELGEYTVGADGVVVLGPPTGSTPTTSTSSTSDAHPGAATARRTVAAPGPEARPP